MSSNLSIRFYLNTHKKSGEKFKIYCRITIDRIKSEFYTGFSVSSDAWDDAKRSTNDTNINAELAEIENKIYTIRRSLLDNQIPLTPSIIVDHYKGKKSTKIYIIEYFSQHVKYIETKGEHAKVTLSQYRTTLKILKQFINDHLKKHDLLLTEINYSFLQNLDSYMLNDYKDPYHRNIERNTINKHHSRVRTVLNKAINEDLLVKSPYNKFKLKDKKTKRDFLNAEELNQIKEHDLSDNPSIAKIRDFFLFSCYTGLRFNDAFTLKMDDIKEDDQGIKFISIKMHKTDDFVDIPLIEDVQEIIEKYNDHPDREVLEFVLPRISNQKINFYLKILADSIGIKKTITHHVARHTFATQALNRGIPVEVVQKLMGHTDIQTTQIYAKMLTSTLVKEMEKMGKVKKDSNLI